MDDNTGNCEDKQDNAELFPIEIPQDVDYAERNREPACVSWSFQGTDSGKESF